MDKPKKEYPNWLVQTIGLIIIVVVLAAILAFLYLHLASGGSCQEYEC